MNIHYYFFQASILSINNINNFITVFQNIDYIIVDSKLIIIPSKEKYIIPSKILFYLEVRKSLVTIMLASRIQVVP